MTRQQEIGNALAHGVLVSAVSTHKFAFADLRLHEQRVEVFEQLLVRL